MLVLLTDCRSKSDQRSALVVVDTAVHFQTLEGFGTSINAWSKDLAGYFDTPEFRRLYLEELGASVLRVDLSGHVVPEREHAADLSYRDYLLEGQGERGAVYLRTAEALTRDSGGALRVVASVWSPPAWMKENASLGNGHTGRKNFGLSDEDIGLARGDEGAPRDGGTPEERQRYLFTNKLRHDRYEHFAKSLVEWTRLYRAHGVELYALSPQNEPRFSHWFGSCVYTPTELANVTRAIVQAFAAEGERLPRLFLPETMTHDTSGNRAYLDALFALAEVAPKVHALAVHGYVDGYQADQNPDSPGRFLALAAPRQRAVWFTEGGTGPHDWPKPLDGLGMLLFHALGAGRASLVLPWQFMEVAATEHALTTKAGPTKKTAVAKHFFRLLRPGMRRVAAKASDATVQAIAFEDSTKKSIALVLVNRTDEAVRATWQGRAASQRLTAREAFVTDRERSFTRLDVPGSEGMVLPQRSISTVVLSLE